MKNKSKLYVVIGSGVVILVLLTIVISILMYPKFFLNLFLKVAERLGILIKGKLM